MDNVNMPSYKRVYHKSSHYLPSKCLQWIVGESGPVEDLIYWGVRWIVRAEVADSWIG